jgi:transposase
MIESSRIVYSDESGIDDNEVKLTGWAQKGKRCFAQKNSERKTRCNITAALNENSLFAPFIFEGHLDTAIYEIYVEQVLAPVLRPGMVVVIDNASFHKSKKVIDIIQAAQCRVMFLPAYSPDFNPIEHHWAAIKNSIRKINETTKNLCEAASIVLDSLCTA